VLGVGWQVEVSAGGSSYQALAIEEYGGAVALSRVLYLHDHVRAGDLIWTRDTRGKYDLARVESPWEYYYTPEGRNADVVNVVRCRLLEVPRADDVSGKIVACFRATRTIESITDSTAVFYSQVLGTELAERTEYAVPLGHEHNIFFYLDSETTEDVVFIYLQPAGWIVIPHSRKTDTMGYEFVVIHSETRDRGVGLDLGGWTGLTKRGVLFQANGVYSGEPSPNVVALSPAAMEDFMRANGDMMPASVRRWLQHTGHRSTP
jgi:hypothetical protein